MDDWYARSVARLDALQEQADRTEGRLWWAHTLSIVFTAFVLGVIIGYLLS